MVGSPVYISQYSISKFLKSEDAKWKKCNNIPSLPHNASEIVCVDAFCAVVCLEGFKSENTWRIKCKSNGKWSHGSFSPCITCSDIEFFDSSITWSTKIRRNLPITQTRCPLQGEKLVIANIACPLNQKTANLRCFCKNDMNELSIHQKTCQWRFQGQLITKIMLKTIQCISGNTPRMNIILSNSSDFESDICKFDLFYFNFNLDDCDFLVEATMYTPTLSMLNRLLNSITETMNISCQEAKTNLQCQSQMSRNKLPEPEPPTFIFNNRETDLL